MPYDPVKDFAHINAEVFKSVAGVDLLHVAYKGGGPAEIVRRLNGELAAILKDGDILARFMQLSTEPVGNSPEQFAAFVKAELDKYARIIKSAGIKLD